ncbi:MAG: hypothetical protein Q8P67_00885 [archaeon]|nr:hypothetical protein [archaeon]
MLDRPQRESCPSFPLPLCSPCAPPRHQPTSSRSALLDTPNLFARARPRSMVACWNRCFFCITPTGQC